MVQNVVEEIFLLSWRRREGIKSIKLPLEHFRGKRYNMSSQRECHWGKNSLPEDPQEMQKQRQKDKEGHMGNYVRPYKMG